MKKYLVLFGAAILVMAFASPSMAQFKSWGHIEIMTIWEVKPDFNTGSPWVFEPTRDRGRSETWRHIAQRYRFYLQYGDPKTVRAVLGFEADSQDWGESAGGGTSGNPSGFPPNAGTVGSASPSGYGSVSNHMGVYRTDMVQLEVKHAYLDFTVPNTPISVSAGLQFFDVGGRMWMNNDAPGVIVTANFAPHRIRAIWWRENDNNRFTYAVNDTYVLAWDMTKQLFNAGAWGAYKNDLFSGQVGSYTFPATAATTIGTVTPTTWGLNPAPGAVETQSYSITLTTPTNKFDDHPWWAGISGGFRPGNFDISGQFLYNGGKRKFTGTNVTATGSTTPTLQGDSTYSGYAGELAVKYRIGPGLFAGIEGFYASGQDWNKPDKITQFFWASSSGGGSGAAFTSSESYAVFGNDRTVFMWMNAAQLGYYHERQTSPLGFAYARANVEFSPLTWLRMNLNYLYIMNTNTGPTAPSGSATSTVTSPYTRTLVAAQVNSPIGARQDQPKSYVGQELNLITTMRIYQNFDYNVGVYIFFPGEMFDRLNTNGTTYAGATASYGLNTKLIYAF